MNAVILVPRAKVFSGFDVACTPIDLAYAMTWGVYVDHIIIFEFALKGGL
jgi:hypothetical protein